MNPEKDIIKKDKDASTGGNRESQPTLLSKAEKLTTAIYMITSFMPAGEPIRDKLRVVNIGILSDISKASLGRSGGTIISAIRETGSLLNVALAMNLISPMNCSILKSEYEELLKRIDLTPGLFKDITLPFTIKDNFFNEVLSEPSPFKKISEGSQYKRQSFIKDNGVEKMSFTSNPKPADKGQKTSSSEKNRQLGLGKKSSRREEILKIVRKMNKVTINDISASLPDYGGKTIQRDLLLLVAQGVLKKEGEKRWSHYFLA